MMISHIANTKATVPAAVSSPLSSSLITTNSNNGDHHMNHRSNSHDSVISQSGEFIVKPPKQTDEESIKGKESTRAENRGDVDCFCRL
jgi:hypothetical protein